MEDVTDTVFRQIIGDLGAPNVYFTEFTSVEGMFSPGADKVSKRLKYEESERPLVAQIWGKTPEKYMKGAKRIKKLGFDGVDLNFGCPVKKIVKQGCCSALIKNKPLAKEIVLAAKEGAGNLPLSIKTRIGFDKIETEEWIGFLLDLDIDVITVHGRTTAELSKVPNHWDEIAKVPKLVREMGKETLVIGNGDVLTLEDGRKKAKEYDLDGIMIGRGIFQNPWLFNEEIDPESITIEMKISTLLSHVKLFEKTWGEDKNFSILKKYFKIYASGFEGAPEFRNKLMKVDSFEEVYDLIGMHHPTLK